MSIIERAVRKRGEALEVAVAPVQSAPAAPTRSTRQVLNREVMARHGLLSPEEAAAHGPLAEQFRHIKRPLLANGLDDTVRNANLIMVTSALPGEGKTYCAINLAISLAMEIDRSVLLVDADVARPSVPDYLGLDVSHGLLDALEQPGFDLGDALVQTDIPNLRILPAGRGRTRANELLASGAMTRLMAEFAERYADRIVVFDSPPLLATSEAGVLARLMGQIVLVVEAEGTPRAALSDAMHALEGCDVIGTVMNKVAPPRALDYMTGAYGHYGRYRDRG